MIRDRLTSISHLSPKAQTKIAKTRREELIAFRNSQQPPLLWRYYDKGAEQVAGKFTPLMAFRVLFARTVERLTGVPLRIIVQKLSNATDDVGFWTKYMLVNITEAPNFQLWNYLEYEAQMVPSAVELADEFQDKVVTQLGPQDETLKRGLLARPPRTDIQIIGLAKKMAPFFCAQNGIIDAVAWQDWERMLGLITCEGVLEAPEAFFGEKILENYAENIDEDVNPLNGSRSLVDINLNPHYYDGDDEGYAEYFRNIRHAVIISQYVLDNTPRTSNSIHDVRRRKLAALHEAYIADITAANQLEIHVVEVDEFMDDIENADAQTREPSEEDNGPYSLAEITNIMNNRKQ